MTGFSRSVAVTAAACYERLSPDAAARERVYRAGLIHGIGRAAVPNDVWNLPTRLPASAWEKVRLVPYWTERAGRQTGALGEAAVLASYAYERQDGSGYFRGVRDAALTLEARVLAASLAWVALRSARPWRAALDDADAAAQLQEEAARGRLCGDVVAALVTGGAPAAGAWPLARRTTARACRHGKSTSCGPSPEGEQQAGRAGALDESEYGAHPCREGVSQARMLDTRRGDAQGIGDGVALTRRMKHEARSMAHDARCASLMHRRTPRPT